MSGLDHYRKAEELAERAEAALAGPAYKDPTQVVLALAALGQLHQGLAQIAGTIVDKHLTSPDVRHAWVDEIS